MCTVSGDLMLREFQVYFVRSITIMVVDIHLVLVAELCAHKHDQQHTRKKTATQFYQELGHLRMGNVFHKYVQAID